MSSTTVNRVLDATAVESLDAYLAAGGGAGFVEAGRIGPDAVVDLVVRSGLRGRGGAGFPTGVKWQTVRTSATDVPTTVVINAAEGEPGSFKDRAIIRANPYRVLEGALIAALVVGAERVIVAMKGSFKPEIAVLRRAVSELAASGWTEGVTVEVREGPGEYLFGEETALLEVLDGRAPFPRVSVPWHHGVDDPDNPSCRGPDPAPALVNNTETLANIAGIVAEGPDWFRSVGTEDSPGTVVCTVSGDTARHAVIELPMGTPLRYLLDEVGGGARRGRHLVAAISGVANAFIPAARFDTPLSHEGMTAAGSGLGAAGFVAFDDAADLVAAAAGISRFLAVESCGQCTPCKQDGLAISDILARLTANDAAELDLLALADRAATVANEARCSLAQQHELIVTSLLNDFEPVLRAHATGVAAAVEIRHSAPILNLANGVADIDADEAGKQPDWTFDPTDSGKAPADRIDQHANDQ